MNMTDESSLHFNHTATGLLWVGLFYFLSWKPEVLEYLWSGSDALASAVWRFLQAIAM